MITFLPLANFACSAMVLDTGELRDAAKHARQVLMADMNGQRGHPQVRDWAGCAPALRLYHDVMCREWLSRGYAEIHRQFLPPPETITMPRWLGLEEFHSAQRARLLAKASGFYQQFGWSEQPSIQILWGRDCK